jgi:hypothetical protein
MTLIPNPSTLTYSKHDARPRPKPKPKPKPKPSTRPVASKMPEDGEAYLTSPPLPLDTLQLCAILIHTHTHTHTPLTELNRRATGGFKLINSPLTVKYTKPPSQPNPITCNSTKRKLRCRRRCRHKTAGVNVPWANMRVSYYAKLNLV